MNRFYFRLHYLWIALVVYPAFRLMSWLIQLVLGRKAACRFGDWWTT